MLRNCHGHNLSKGNIIRIFYHGLSEITQEVLNVAAYGTFLYKTPNQAYQLLEDKVLLKLNWVKNKKTKSSLKKTVAFADEGSSNSDTDKIMARMDAMTLKTDAQYKELQSNAKKTKPDLYKDEIPMSREEEAKFMQTFPKNHQASIQNLETKFERLADKQSGRPSRSLPSNTQPNPRENNSKAYQPSQASNEHVNVVFTRSGKSYNPQVNPNDQQENSGIPINFNSDDEDDGPTPQPKPQNPKPAKETPFPKPYKPKIPYLQPENLLVEVGKFTFPVDFVIFEMEEDNKVFLILGQPFIYTANAVIRVKQKQLNLGVGTKRMIFNIDSPMKHSYSNDDTCFIIDVIDEILEEDFDAFLDEEPPFKKITLNTNYKIKTSLEEPPTDLELKPLPDNLEYVFLEEPSFLPVIISSQLFKEKKNKLISVLKKHKQAFAWKTTDILGICPSFCKQKIQLLDDKKPVIQKQRRLDQNMQEVVKKGIMKLLDSGINYPIADSPWVSPIHCIPKKGGITVVTNKNDELVPTRIVTGWRVCIDYDKLNEATAKIISLCRLWIKYKTAFICPFRTYAYRRMPFGLCNAPATFQRCKLAIFHDIIEESVKVFMDDFSVFGNSFETCLNNLDKMPQCCKDAHLILNWEKCHFMVKEGIVLGHKVSSVGLEVDKAKINVISKLPPLPILKEKLTCAPVIVSPNWNLPFELMCDARDFAVGAVLVQKDGKNFHPIYFASKTLYPAQQKYPVTEKELMAVVFAFDKFKSNLILLKTIVHTDHAALRHLFKKQDAKPRLIRWILLLQEFSIQIKDRKGTENVTADHLSRIENEEISDESEVDDNFPGETLMEINTKDEPCFTDFANYLVGDVIPKEMTYQQKKNFSSTSNITFGRNLTFSKYVLTVCSDAVYLDQKLKPF
uniref:RNA-directed DNA polymerase n=1 Tax=Tanacetum cinerariifolium TaxID=118510 RepID=A0A699GR87_TANCI|nr:DNA-directed DNA polymerase [Tanacetum cinerariifolium]